MCIPTSVFQTSHSTLGYHHSLNTLMSDRASATTSSSNFEVIFEKALKTYKRTSGQGRTVHPLFCQLQACDSPAAIRSILQNQIDQFIQSRSGDERLKNWLNPTINVLYAFSVTLAGGVGVVMAFFMFRRYHPYANPTGFPCRQCDFCWCWCPPFGKCPHHSLVTPHGLT